MFIVPRRCVQSPPLQRTETVTKPFYPPFSFSLADPEKTLTQVTPTECNLRAFWGGGGKKTGTQQLVWFIHSSMSSVVTSLPVLPCPSSKRRLVMRDLDSIILIHDQSVFTCMFELLPCSVPCPSNFVSLLWDTGLIPDECLLQLENLSRKIPESIATQFVRAFLFLLSARSKSERRVLIKSFNTSNWPFAALSALK